jgi:hypothetical protein
MAFFVQLLANYAGLIYIALIVGAVFYFREIIAARQDLQQSLYSLEREAANSRMWRSLLMLGLLALIAAATFVLSTVIAPQVTTDEGQVTPTPAFTLPTNTPTPTFQPTPTRTPRPPTATRNTNARGRGHTGRNNADTVAATCGSLSGSQCADCRAGGRAGLFG